VPAVLDCLPRSSTLQDITRYTEALRTFRLHGFGAAGTRAVLANIGIGTCPREFFFRAQSALKDTKEVGRVGGYLEYSLFQQSHSSAPPWHGSISCGSGADSTVNDKHVLSHLLPTPLHFEAELVDRSVCAEFKLCSRLLQEAQQAKILSVDELGACQIHGHVYLFTTSVPCASCTGVLSQLRALLPLVTISVDFSSTRVGMPSHANQRQE